MKQPNIEYIAIASEVLSGNTVNTNAAFIGKFLKQSGFALQRQLVIPDNIEEMKTCLKEAFSRSDVILTTGGLGPTVDDLSRQVAAEYFHSHFHYDTHLAEDLKKRFGMQLLSLKDQATVPDKAELIPNPNGTAPGFIFSEEGKLLIMMPGVPQEMEPMLIDHVLPYLKKHFPTAHGLHSESLHFYNLFESMVDPLLRELYQQYPHVEFGIYPALGLLHVQLSGPSTEVKDCKQKIAEAFSGHLYEGAKTIEESIYTLFSENNLTLACAESCTGGALASRLTKIPGVSKIFLGSVVAYSNEAKHSILGVTENALNSHGAVSPEVAREMVIGALRLYNSDYALAVTGILGPSGGTPQKPVGTIWCAMAKRGQEPRTWLLQGKGSREMMVERSVNGLLGELYAFVNAKENRSAHHKLTKS